MLNSTVAFEYSTLINIHTRKNNKNIFDSRNDSVFKTILK